MILKHGRRRRLKCTASAEPRHILSIDWQLIPRDSSRDSHLLVVAPVGNIDRHRRRINPPDTKMLRSSTCVYVCSPAARPLCYYLHTNDVSLLLPRHVLFIHCAPQSPPDSAGILTYFVSNRRAGGPGRRRVRCLRNSCPTDGRQATTVGR